MTSSQIYYMLDGNSSDIVYGGGDIWSDYTNSFYFGGGSHYPGGGSVGNVTLAFQGTSIAIVGDTSAYATTDWFTASIDNSAPANTTWDNVAYFPWYKSSGFNPAGTHILTLGDINAISLDYVLVEPGLNTPLAGRNVMVDDNYMGIQYTGNWNEVNGQHFSIQDTYVPGWALGNTTHQTSRIGDSFKFSYTGTNLTIYGFMVRDQSGTFELSVTLDDGIPLKLPFTSQVNNGDTTYAGKQLNFPLYTTGPVDAGNHTVVFNVTACAQQLIVVDYIIYEPSFATWAMMPNLTSVVQAAGLSAKGKKTPVGAIAGGVTAACVILALLALLFLWKRKRVNHPPAYIPSQAEPETFVEKPDGICQIFFAHPRIDFLQSPKILVRIHIALRHIRLPLSHQASIPRKVQSHSATGHSQPILRPQMG
ncbi:hypothetical protein C8J56DRAFT_872510 [Mycena floridula]|nr:hypothetical protein C8J56DRAFT_872510 [Mycena floridula]